ncbi:ABC transporter ATP-binding protein [Pediococcus acidilactici]
MNTLIVKNLTKKYPHQIAVNQIDLKIKAGEFVAFLGPNGAGKTTTINMLIGLISPTSGSIELAGLHPTDSDYRQMIGVVFQNSLLDKKMSVRQNIQSRANMYSQTSSNWLQFLFKHFHLNNLLKQPYGTLSGGQRRRVDIVRALVNQPEVLFLDEPSTGLDIQTRTTIWQAIHKLQQTTKMTVILTTHYLEETEQADYVYVIDREQIIADDTVTNLKLQYAQYSLTLIPNSRPALQQALLKNNSSFSNVATGFELHVASIDEILQIVGQYRALLTAFECRQGNMSDIFLALTGKEVN